MEGTADLKPFGDIRWQRVLVADGRIDNTFVGVVCKTSTSTARREEKRVAIKRVSKTGEYLVDTNKISQLVKEQEKCHANVVKYYAFEGDSDFWYLVTEMFDHTLATYVQTLWEMTSPKGFRYVETALYHFLRLPSSEKIRYVTTVLCACHQAAQGLQYLHEKLKWPHGDVTPVSFLIRANNERDMWAPVCKISNTGLRRHICDGNLTLSSNLDYKVLGWLAPELIANPCNYSKKNDVWALGCVVFYALTGGKHPFGENLAQRVIDMSSGKNYLNPILQRRKLQYSVANDLKETLSSMIKRETNERPKIDQKLINAFLPRSTFTPEGARAEFKQRAWKILWMAQYSIGWCGIIRVLINN